MSKLESTIAAIGPLDSEAMAAARQRQERLTKPPGSLGRLEELSVLVAGITGNPSPVIKEKVVVVMASDHGVVAEAVSAYPQAVTMQMVANFLRGGAAINVLSRHVGARVVVVDIGTAGTLEPNAGLLVRKVRPGTSNLSLGPAMSLDEAQKSIEVGIEVAEAEIASGADIIATGDMGIGNTTASSAIIAAITGASPSLVTGLGTGITERQREHKIHIIERALAINTPDAEDAMDVLAKVGGLEIGGLAGVILAAAAHRRPVVIDGLISGAAALIAWGLCPSVKDYMIPSHLSVERGHRILLDWLGLRPMLDFDLRLGEGTGAALGISIIEAAVKLLNEMATLDEAGVSGAIAEVHLLDNAFRESLRQAQDKHQGVALDKS
ncbi:MAG: nicotinate-nucleotide--dimethylbenzimidazole phosphoribosyltransferase [Dehalococcoidia bacterium]|nr:nicotinate-nucleotide--dimethylbenzimidazole phosphoribosyltransferase [Dehalococcoidia bacterium]